MQPRHSVGINECLFYSLNTPVGNLALWYFQNFHLDFKYFTLFGNILIQGFGSHLVP